MIDEMKGSTMIARIRPAVRMPMPNGGPENSAPITGTRPMVWIRNGCTVACMNGANTNRPQMP